MPRPALAVRRRLPHGRVRFRVPAIALAVLGLLAGCTTSRTVGGPSASPTGPSQAPSVPLPSGSAGSAGAPAIASLPSGCDGVPVPATSSVTFVAGGRVWAVAPDDPSGLHCLFTATVAGLFSWGPRGDRVVLAGLEVRGVGSPASRPPANLHPSYFSWSRPTGTTVVFTDQSRHGLFRADVGRASTSDITPVPGVTYGDIAYHPSGLAIGFVSTDSSGSAVWTSTNLGKDPVRLVQAPPGTTFGQIVFARDGLRLFYSVDKADGTHALAGYELPTGKVQPALWSGGAPISDIVEAGAGTVALTVGSSCAQRQVVVSSLDGTGGRVLPGQPPQPASVVGRLGTDRLLVAGGGCGNPEDLYVMDSSGPRSSLLIRFADAAATRQPEATPAPPLPQNLPRSGFA